jgi:sec-independent protein translocase protein TatA
MLGLSPGKLVLIILILLLVFGTGRISEVGKGLGEGLRSFKKGLRGNSDNKPKS